MITNSSTRSPTRKFKHELLSSSLRILRHLISVDIRLLESDISHCTLSTHVPHSEIVNISALVLVVLVWVSLRGPTGVPTDTQAGWYQGQSANDLAAALLLHCTELDTCTRVRPSLNVLPQTQKKHKEKQGRKKGKGYLPSRAEKLYFL